MVASTRFVDAGPGCAAGRAHGGNTAAGRRRTRSELPVRDRARATPCSGARTEPAPRRGSSLQHSRRLSGSCSGGQLALAAASCRPARSPKGVDTAVQAVALLPDHAALHAAGSWDVRKEDRRRRLADELGVAARSPSQIRGIASIHRPLVIPPTSRSCPCDGKNPGASSHSGRWRRPVLWRRPGVGARPTTRAIDRPGARTWRR